MDSQSWFSGMWAGVGWWGISFVFLRRQYATLEIRGAVLGGLVGHDPCCCSGVSEPARRAGSAMDSQSWFLVWAGVLQWTLKAGFLVCGLVSQPARRAGSAMDSQSWFSGMWAGVGWWGISFVFLRRQYATLEIRGAVLGGLAQSWFCNGLSKLVSGMGWCSAMDSQSWFSGMWAGVATSPQSWFCNGLSKLVFWYVGWCGLVGHKLCFFKASVRNVRDSGRRAGRSCWARSLLLFWCFGIGPQSWFCNGLSKLVSGMGW